MSGCLKRLFRQPSLLLLLVFCLGLTALYAGPSGATIHTQAEAVPGKAAAAESHSDPGLFDIDLTILAGQVINFLFVFFILKRFLFAPIQGVLEERRKRIKQNLDAAEAQKRDAGQLKAAYEKKLSDVEQEISVMRRTAIAEAQAAKDEIIGEAKRNADLEIERAKKEIELERAKSWMQLRKDLVDLTMEAAERVISASLDDEHHRVLIAQTIERLEHEIGAPSIQEKK